MSRIVLPTKAQASILILLSTSVYLLLMGRHQLLLYMVSLVAGIVIYTSLSGPKAIRYLLAISFPILLYLVFVRSGYLASGSYILTMDDGYIYGNYIVNAARGHLFEYTPGVKSGGITGLLWYFCQIPLMRLLLTRYTPAEAIPVSAFIVSGLCVYAMSALVFWLSRSLYSKSLTACLLIALCSNFQLIWSELSGLENPLSIVLLLCITCAAYSIDYVDDTTAHQKRMPIIVMLFASMLTFSVRPDLLSFLVGALLYLLIRNVKSSYGRRLVQACIGFAVLGVLLQFALYKYETGRPLPSSFYAKVQTSANLPAQLGLMLSQATGFEISIYAMFAFTVFLRIMRREPSRRWLLPILVISTSLATKALSLPILGQEHRYVSVLLPIVLIFGAGELIYQCEAAVLLTLNSAGQKNTARWIAGVFALSAVSWFASHSERTLYFQWILTRRDGDIRVGKWLAANTPTTAIVASEPIGTIHTFSGRSTVDVVGLTSTEYLGSYPDWNKIMSRFRKQPPDYLVYYPAWFRSNGFPECPPGFSPVFIDSVSNPIYTPAAIGSSPIVVYKIDPVTIERNAISSSAMLEAPPPGGLGVGCPPPEAAARDGVDPNDLRVATPSM